MFYDDTKKSGNNEKINNFYHGNVFADFELVAYRMNGSFDKYLRSLAASNLFYLTSFSIFFTPFADRNANLIDQGGIAAIKMLMPMLLFFIHTTFDIFLDDVNLCVPC